MQTKGSPALSYGVIILAAGASSRMGQPKLLLPWGLTSILGHLISQWQGLGAGQIAVVYAMHDQAILHELDHLGFPAQNRIPNPTPDLGMFSSIQCAARWSEWNVNLSHWIITLGDQPHLLAATLSSLIHFGAEHPQKICQPSRNGHPRHPVLFPKAGFTRLAHSSAENLKSFLQTVSSDRAICEMDDPGLDLDIDQPADYERAMQSFFNRRGV